MQPISIYLYEKATVFIKDWIQALPRQGRGTGIRLAQHLGVSATMVSQILSDEKPLSLETAIQIADFIGLNDRETDFFLLLVERDRAGHHRLRARAEAKIRAARQASEKLENRVKVDQELDEFSKAIYYSSWIYTAVRNLSALPEINDVESLSNHLHLPRSTVARVVQFLVEKGLCQIDEGKLTYQKKWTHIPAQSPLVLKHHQNWRLRGFHVMDEFREDDFFFTGSMSMSAEVAAQIRTRILGWIESVQKDVGPSNSEVVKCLNIDWFGF